MLLIVDSGVANVGSIANMLRRVGVTAQISGDPAVVAQATKLILPGVGAFDAGMRSLTDRGLVPALREAVIGHGIPILGLCLGMHMLTKGSEEGKDVGLGLVDARCVRFNFPDQPALKVPHMGWNRVKLRAQHPLFSDMDQDARFYFVHSFYVTDAGNATLGTTEFGGEFTSVIVQKNIHGVQFHPEKSHRYGMQLLRNYVEML